MIPQEIVDDEWKLEDEVLKQLETSSTNDIYELLVFDVEKKTFETKYWPSEEHVLE